MRTRAWHIEGDAAREPGLISRRMHSPLRQHRAASGSRALLLASLLLAAGCAPREAASNEIAIAVALNPQRPGMQSIYNGVQLAVNELNGQSRGKLGSARLIMLKGAADVSDAVRIADAFRQDARVVGVVGHPESGTTLNVINRYADAANDGENGVVVISPTATTPALSGANRWLFRVCPSDVQSSLAVARFLLDSLGARRASVIYRNDAYGKDWAKAFADNYRALKGVVVQRDPYLQGATAWDAYAGYLKLLKPDAVLFPGSQEDALLALRAMRAAGVDAPFIGGDATSGLEANAQEFPGVRYTAFFLARRATSPEAKTFIAAYTAAYKEEPDQRAALAYDAAMLIGRGVLEVGTNRAKVRDYVESIGRERPAMAGAAGPIAFDVKHDAVNKPVVIARVGR